MKIISGNSNRQLAAQVAAYLGTELSPTNITRFADGEINIELNPTLKDEDCVIIQPTAKSMDASMNDNIMELYFMIDAVRRIPAKSITVVLPYFGYARQDRRVFPQSPISSKVISKQIEALGADNVIILDLHCEQTLGFFDIPAENIYALPILTADMKNTFPDMSNTVIVAPDMGASKKARVASEVLGCTYAVVEKKRPRPGESQVMNLIGVIEGKDCILLDDMIDSAGTLCNAANALMERGAKSVRAYATHGLFSGQAFKRINDSAFTEVVVTDSINIYAEPLPSPKVRHISCAEVLGDAIKTALGI
ncbi:MAG: ribose-phosphate pyrophosphokinase [Alphaproteobacteria bacterium]|nr:ribose-phosphate pyrophosphokinase [Alphaproteobacteria bacterium]